PPFKEVEFDIIYGEGVSREGDLLDLATNSGIIEKSGAWFTFGGERLGQGRENAKQFFKENPKIAQAIERKVLENYGVVRPDEKQARVKEKKQDASYTQSRRA